MSDSRPIGVFDSGLGGLCAVRELRRLLPEENIVYFGDTGRVPYGTKSPETIKKYAREDAEFLLSKGVKLALAACGTVSAVALDEMKEHFPVPLFGVIAASVDAALRETKTGTVAVIGTDATIKSGLFDRKLREKGCADVISRACPLFVPLVECGFIARENELTRGVAEMYLSDIGNSRADTLILGCTHFPIISEIIGDVLPNITLIDPAKEAAALVAAYVRENGVGGSGGKTEYFVSDDAESFSASAKIFLKTNEKINASVVKI